MSVLTNTVPAEPHAAAKARIAAAVAAARPEILGLSHRIHADPEPAYEEHHAAAWVAEALARHGFDVEAPAELEAPAPTPTPALAPISPAATLPPVPWSGRCATPTFCSPKFRFPRRCGR